MFADLSRDVRYSARRAATVDAMTALRAEG